MLQHHTSRRGFLKGSGSLVVTVSLVSALPAVAAATVAGATVAGAAPANQAPPSLSPAPDQLDSWLKIEADGTVKAFTGHVELGQGNQTALSQIVAEELDVPLSHVDLTMGDTTLTPDEGYTAGSTTIRTSGAHLRAAAAEARLTLIGLAATHLGVPADQLQVHDGVISPINNPAASVSYGELIGDKQFNVQLTATKGGFGLGAVSGKATPKDPSQYKLVGTSAPRLDFPGKMNGTFTYMQDVRVPGMVHGRVVRPDGIHSKLVSVDGFSEDVPGVQVLTRGDFVGVIADTEWAAIRGATALQVTWSDWGGLPDMSDISSVIRGSASKDHPADHKGDATAALDAAATGLSATYETPFEMHGSIGPSCAIADVQADKAMIWAGTQGPHQLQGDLAKLLEIPQANIHVTSIEAAGCYGRNGADLVAADAAVMSQLAGKPVRVQWMRNDEHVWEPKGPAMVQDLLGGLDANGNVVGWSHTVWTPPHYGSTYIAGDLIGKPVGLPIMGAFNTPVLIYEFPNVAIFQFDQSDFANAIRTAWLRGPAQFQTTFAMEAFMDELAASAGVDPIQFRLTHLKDQRSIDVLNAVAQAANWDTRPSPLAGAATGQMSTGRGFAMANRDDTLIAEVAEVQVDRSNGAVKVTRFWAAQDCGLIINPKAVQAQIESNITQATSRTLKEEVQFDASNVTTVDWRGYPILTFPEVPEIHTVLINRPDQPATGVGEAATCPVAAAISNAIFDATGVRLRSLPFRPDRIVSAFQAASA
jgi:nicotinate dehydrogenase subunit B